MFKSFFSCSILSFARFWFNPKSAILFTTKVQIRLLLFIRSFALFLFKPVKGGLRGSEIVGAAQEALCVPQLEALARRTSGVTGEGSRVGCGQAPPACSNPDMDQVLDRLLSSRDLYHALLGALGANTTALVEKSASIIALPPARSPSPLPQVILILRACFPWYCSSYERAHSNNAHCAIVHIQVTLIVRACSFRKRLSCDRARLMQAQLLQPKDSQPFHPSPPCPGGVAPPTRLSPPGLLENSCGADGGAFGVVVFGGHVEIGAREAHRQGAQFSGSRVEC